MAIHISEKEAAQQYGLSVHWFRRKRWEGGGPVYRKIGNLCLYTVNDLDRYFSECTCKNTSEYHTRKPVEAIDKKKTILAT